MVFQALQRNCLVAALLMLAFLAPAAAQESKPLRLVVLGDSLVAGFNIPLAQAFPAQLERALKAKGYAVEVINAGVSGDTTAAGLDRLQWAVPEKSDAVILELGANDALRGLSPVQAKRNLDKIIVTLKGQGSEVLLAGMVAPRNLGAEYVAAFDGMYAELAKAHDLLLYPFFLDGIALDSRFNLGDGLHPNPNGVAEITKRILPKVEELIARVRAKQQNGSKG